MRDPRRIISQYLYVHSLFIHERQIIINLQGVAVRIQWNYIWKALRRISATFQAFSKWQFLLLLFIILLLLSPAPKRKKTWTESHLTARSLAKNCWGLSIIFYFKLLLNSLLLRCLFQILQPSLPSFAHKMCPQSPLLRSPKNKKWKGLLSNQFPLKVWLEWFFQY